MHDLPVPDSFVNLICGPRGHRIAIRITNGDKGIGTNSTVDRNTWILVLERDHCDFRDMPVLGDAGAHSPFVGVANLSVFCGVVPPSHWRMWYGQRGSLRTRGRDLLIDTIHHEDCVIDLSQGKMRTVSSAPASRQQSHMIRCGKWDGQTGALASKRLRQQLSGRWVI